MQRDAEEKAKEQIRSERSQNATNDTAAIANGDAIWWINWAHFLLREEYNYYTSLLWGSDTATSDYRTDSIKMHGLASFRWNKRLTHRHFKSEVWREVQGPAVEETHFDLFLRMWVHWDRSMCVNRSNRPFLVISEFLRWTEELI